jgi:hypothetical protein
MPSGTAGSMIPTRLPLRRAILGQPMSAIVRMVPWRMVRSRLVGRGEARAGARSDRAGSGGARGLRPPCHPAGVSLCGGKAGGGSAKRGGKTI